MIPIPLEEEYRNMTRKELESKLMEFPELEEKLIEVQHDLILDSSMVYKDTFCLGGMNEQGEHMTIWFDSHEFLKCVDKKKLKEIKTALIKTIKKI